MQKLYGSSYEYTTICLILLIHRSSHTLNEISSDFRDFSFGFFLFRINVDGMIIYRFRRNRVRGNLYIYEALNQTQWEKCDYENQMKKIRFVLANVLRYYISERACARSFTEDLIKWKFLCFTCPQLE